MKTQMKNWNEQLTEHFTLREFVVSRTAMVKNIDNTPTDEVVERLTALCEHVLEPLRRRFGVIRVTSGYRSEELNRLVGGVKHSQHCRGEAADLHVGSRETGRKMFLWIVDHLDFDQLLFERSRDGKSRWLHVSYRPDGPNRRQYNADYVARARNYCTVYCDKN